MIGIASLEMDAIRETIVIGLAVIYGVIFISSDSIFFVDNRIVSGKLMGAKFILLRTSSYREKLLTFPIFRYLLCFITTGERKTTYKRKI